MHERKMVERWVHHSPKIDAQLMQIKKKQNKQAQMR